jgi:AcrR family transcriptional regulator
MSGDIHIYLYFKTREEIYMALLQDSINQWIPLIETMGEIKDQSIKGILAVICLFIEEKHAFMKLASILNGIHEKNIDFEIDFMSELKDTLQIIWEGSLKE